MNSSTAAALLVVIALTSACRLDMHVQPRQNPLSHSDFYRRSALRAPSGRRHRRPRPVERRHLFLYRQNRQQSRATYMPFPVTKEVLERGRERLQHLLRSLPLARRRRQRLRSVARILAQAAVVSHRAPAEGARRIFLRRDDRTASASCPTTLRRFPPQDRWNIVAYIRALQLSQNATHGRRSRRDRRFRPSLRSSASPDRERLCRKLCLNRNRNRVRKEESQ